MDKDGKGPIHQALFRLGLTALEADVYVCLLQSSPATGYKVAKSAERSFPNTYKALESLLGKGAVLMDDGATRLWRAVPLEELFDQYESRFREMREKAIEASELLPRSLEDTGIYQLETVPQVIERCRSMLDVAEERVLLELFPEPLAALRDAVEKTAERGVCVAARIYRQDSLKNVHLVHSPFGEETLELFRSQWVAVFVDGRQFLLGHLVTGGQAVHQAIWSRNPFLARAFYDYVNSDLFHYRFRSRLESALTLEDARAAYRETEELFPAGGDLGFREMQALLRQSESSRVPARGRGR